MTHVVTESCIFCKYTDCVTVCPVDCFYEGPNYLVIHPDECIDCGLCIAECPVNAICHEDELGAPQQVFMMINDRLAKVWPVITKAVPPLPEAERWAQVAHKLPYLDTGGVDVSDLLSGQSPVEES